MKLDIYGAAPAFQRLRVEFRDEPPRAVGRLRRVAALDGFAGLDGVQALEEIRTSNDSVREEFLARTRLLERLRGDVYVSGTYVRDYLLEPESGKAEGHRYSLLESRTDTDAALAAIANWCTRVRRGRSKV
jgi:hypothetical protein